jgi:UDP-N-acetylmuramoyl-tripeptide--D-alanyl-D-alanine ligase
VVEDTFLALQKLGHAGRQRSKAKIIAVTGSVGKTGSKEMLRLMLGACGATYANEGSLNNHWGVPLSLARLPADARYGVFELGMNHAGELGPLSRAVQPHVALITTIELAHLEFFTSIDAIADAKAEIFLGMKPDGVAVLNSDNRQFGRLARAAKAYGLKKILGFGKDHVADACLRKYRASADSGEIEADILGHTLRYSLGAPGAHLAMNSLGALLAAIQAGGDAVSCAAALALFKSPNGRGLMQIITVADGAFTLIDESYNASPAAVRAAITVLANMKPSRNGRRILVLGDMRELGKSAKALHVDLARELMDAKIDMFFGCGDMTAHLFEVLPVAMRGVHSKDSAALAPLLVKAIHAGDIVTVKGSLSMNMRLLVDALKALGPSAPQKLAS